MKLEKTRKKNQQVLSGLKLIQSTDRKKAKKANKGLFGLTLVRKETDREGRLVIYHSLIQSHLKQNLLASGRSAKGDIDRLEWIQRKGIRIVEGLGMIDNTAQAMKSLQITPISEQYKYLNSLWGLKVYTGMVPEGVQKLFEKNQSTRNLLVPKYKTQRAQRLSPAHSIATEWNKLDKTLKNYILDMPLTFETKKKKLKFYYLHGRDSEEVKTMLENCKT